MANLGTLETNLQKAEKTTDRLSKPLDPGIKRAVALLWTLGFDTENSCYGHDQYANGGPFIWITSQNWQKKVKLWQEKNANDPTKVDQQHILETAGLRSKSKLINLLEEFYKDRSTSLNTRLIVQNKAFNSSWLCCQGVEVADGSTDERLRLDWLQKAQQEFDDFTKFLQTKVEN